MLYIHAVKGFTKALYFYYVNTGFGDKAMKMAQNVTEFFAHLQSDIMVGENLKFSPAFTTYYPEYFFKSLMNFR
ncbi:hypothetical protein CHA01nite_33280 [Chryseobacterium hagamense]|uniref:Uncharacterized protein n=1 Tax=Chryseobacterium hagamense TaxID=395935 RepID=A0A511YQX6_9FLAO|nr:hypothetical protein CHA01nite_33280 [Chryseobacterium hagamense]